ncbi:venom protein 302-like [Oratosquilla oratoria]|uniref:venom protein 302-like n=1 Tax=Oratosquilla oratoria TaxID=337810 RepID=UPI003F76AB1F
MGPRVAVFGLTLLVFLMLATERSAGHSCVCRGECPKLDESECKYGVGKDKCFCCDVCLNGPGEICGGHFDTDGKCGTGLRCWKGPRPTYYGKGICAFEDAIDFPEYTDYL